MLGSILGGFLPSKQPDILNIETNTSKHQKPAFTLETLNQLIAEDEEIKEHVNEIISLKANDRKQLETNSKNNLMTKLK